VAQRARMAVKDMASLDPPARAFQDAPVLRFFRDLGATRLAAMGFVLLVGGGAAALVAQPPAPPPPAEIAMPEIRVAGEKLAAHGDAVGNALDLVRRYARGTLKLRLPSGKVVDVRRAELGITIDRARLADFVTAAMAPDGIVRKSHAVRAPDEPLDVPLPLALDEKATVAKLLDVKATSDLPAEDAKIDVDARKVQPEQVGHRLDVYATVARIEAALRDGKEEVEVAVVNDAPKVLAASLADIKFDHVLGWFETRYTPGKKSEDRTFNLRLAASKLDGRVVMPGEEFDFNAVVGPRDEAHGYRVAPVIAQGELVDGLGGGTCQISGTLHAAVFFAGLEIVQRYPHSRPSSYIKMGLDATVAYPNITYKFRNSLDVPIVLREKVAGGIVRAEILGPERKLTVSFFRRIDDVLPFEEVERETPKLPEGERIVTQRGIPGFLATSSRVVRDGAYAERTKWTEKYPPTTQIVAVGTAPKDAKARLVPDSHSEYVVDEILVVTQGPGLKTPGVAADERGGGMIEQRTPGKTGEAGWIEKLGLSKTPLDPGKPDDESAKPDADGSDKDKAKGDGDKSDKDKDKAKGDGEKSDKDKPKKDKPKKDDDKADEKKGKKDKKKDKKKDDKKDGAKKKTAAKTDAERG
jgi:vancomycin resistance protein YoaR